MSNRPGADAVAALMEAAATAAKASAANPDAEFIRICAGHRARIVAFNTSRGDAPPEEAAYERSRDFINGYEPSTMEGLIAKAHAARAEAERPEGTFEPNGTPAETWCWEIAMALIEMDDSEPQQAQVRGQRRRREG